MDIAELDKLRDQIKTLISEKEELILKLSKTEKVVKITNQKLTGKAYFPNAQVNSRQKIQVQAIRTDLTPDGRYSSASRYEYIEQEMAFEYLVKEGLIQIQYAVVPGETIETYENLDDVIQRLRAKFEEEYSARFLEYKDKNEKLMAELQSNSTKWQEKLDIHRKNAETTIESLKKQIFNLQNSIEEETELQKQIKANAELQKMYQEMKKEYDVLKAKKESSLKYKIGKLFLKN